MKLVQVNAIVDIIAMILLVPATISGAVMLWILPSGTGGFRGGTGILIEPLFLGLSRQEWRTMHQFVVLAFLIIMVIHFLFHWKYIRNIRKPLQGK